MSVNEFDEEQPDDHMVEPSREEREELDRLGDSNA